MPNCKYKALKRYAAGFFRDDDRLWKCNTHGTHKWVLYCDRRIQAIHVAHDDVGHRRYFVTHALVAEWYW